MLYNPLLNNRPGPLCLPGGCSWQWSCLENRLCFAGLPYPGQEAGKAITCFGASHALSRPRCCPGVPHCQLLLAQQPRKGTSYLQTQCRAVCSRELLSASLKALVKQKLGLGHPHTLKSPILGTAAHLGPDNSPVQMISKMLQNKAAEKKHVEDTGSAVGRARGDPCCKQSWGEATPCCEPCCLGVAFLEHAFTAS